MYNFVDTIEASAGYKLPAEALKINGEYIENLIPGYRTLNVAGREALSPDIVSFTTGTRDGAKLRSKRYPERILIVTYQITAKTNEEFRESYNKLGKILNVENAQLIFNDEQDKYYIGTPCYISEVAPGRNSVVSKFEILCVDPFKYSLTEYEALPGLDESSILINYNGTYKSFPKLQAEFASESEVLDDGVTTSQITGKGDCGFVAFFTEDEKIIQLGDPEEVDGTDEYEKSQTLLNQLFHKSTCWGSATQALLTHNSGDVISSDFTQAGTFNMAPASYIENPKKIEGTILNAWSDTGEPKFNYIVTLKLTDRTQTNVKVNVTITTSLKYEGSYFGRGYSLQASLYIMGTWHNIKIKDTSEYWKGQTAHVTNASFILSGIVPTTDSLEKTKFKVTRTDSVGGTAGTLYEKECVTLPLMQYGTQTVASYYLAPKSYGYDFGAPANVLWHGPTTTKTLPADSSGTIGATDFCATQGIRMGIDESSDAAKQYGAIQVQICTSSGKHIAGFRIFKNKIGTTGNLHYFVNGVKVLESGFDFSYNNEVFGASANGVATITKSGNEITFSVGRYKKVFVDDAITDLRAVRITYAVEQYANNTPLAYIGFNWIKFVKNNCSTIKDIPNKFSANDILTADCKSGEIYLNGILSPEYGALGNDWEMFYLKPGLNQIGFAYSDFVSSNEKPTIKVKYREVYL